MGSGWHEWPLMIFTVFGQCVVGALIVSGLGWLTAKTIPSPVSASCAACFLWLVMGWDSSRRLCISARRCVRLTRLTA